MTRIPLISGRRRLLVLVADVAMFVVAYAAADFVRMDLLLTDATWHQFGRTVVPFVLLKAAVFALAGNYRGLILYATLNDVGLIVRNSTYASVAGAALLGFLPAFHPYSRGVLVIDWMLTILLLSASRVIWRLVREGALSLWNDQARLSRKKVLIVGAGRAGVALAKDLMTRQRKEVQVIGFVDDDPDKQNATVLGRPILGKVKDLAEILKIRPVDQVIVAIPSAPPRSLKRIAELAKNVRDFRVVPPLETLLRNRTSLVQSVDVPNETFLSREAVDLAAVELKRFFRDKTILVTGAGGSIGGELARQLATQEGGRLEKLLLLDCAETPLYDIHRQTAASIGSRAVPLLASVRDMARMADILDEWRPDVILHAAALKHVPMCEAHPLEAIATNTCATARLADLALEHGIPNFTLVSTDKAVSPSCVMGASKRAAETYVHSMANDGRTRFTAVRFGNVLGSNGSVLPLFQEQIAGGGPVTITHPDATRYFMTIPEACGLILQATRIAQGDEIYVLDMGEPVRILDLAHNLIRLHGYEPGKDIEVKIVGLRPGEKLHESLVDEGEEAEPMHHAKLLRISASRPSRDGCVALLDSLEHSVQSLDTGSALSLLRAMVPTFAPERWAALRRADKPAARADKAAVHVDKPAIRRVEQPMKVAR